MRFEKLLLAFILVGLQAVAQPDSLHLYLIPGQGSDERLFNNIKLDSNYIIHRLHHEVPEKGMNMQAYAKLISQQLDTTQRFILIGVSLGGMLATEMMEFMHPEKVIIISSAKRRAELPTHYRFQRFIPLYKIVPGFISKFGAQLLQPIVEPDRKQEKETFKKMLKAKSPSFYRRSIAMIMQWKRATYDKSIIHIHGSKDHTIPIRNVSYNYMIEGGSHMMTLTEGEKISDLLKIIIKE